MKEQHELDRLLKDKFDAREFEFQDAYWEEAAGLIAAAEAADKKPAGFWWRWLLLDSVFAFAVAAGMLFSYSLTQTKTQTPTQTISQAQIQDSNPNHNQIQTQNSTTTELKPSESSSLTSINPSHSQNSTTSSLDKTSSLSTNPNPSAKTETLMPSPNDTGDNNATPHFTSPAQNQSTATELNPTELQDAFSARIKNIDSSAFLSYTLQAQGATPDQRLLPVSQQAEKIQKHSFALVLGTQTSTGFAGTEEQKFSHWPTLGLAYRYAINSRLRIQSGLMLENRGALSLNKDFISTQFGFGRNEQTVSLQPQSAHYLAVPLQFGYRIQKRHSLNLGLNAGYLLNVRSTLTTQTTDPFGTLTSTTEKAWNYRQGFQKLDAGILLGYTFQFRPKMGIMLEAYQGLRDISDDTFWGVERADKQRQVRLKVYWNLF